MSEMITIFDKLASIGCQFSEVKLVSVDIEATIAEAIEILPYSKERGRILKVLCSWIVENGNQVILEKLSKFLTVKANEGSDVSYAALLGAFAVTHKLHKWSILKRFKPKELVSIAEKKVGFAEEPWASEVNFCVSKSAIQADPKYTLTRKQVAKMHKQYRNRLMYGAQYRADIVTAVQLGFTSVKSLVNLIGVSREPASRILADLKDAGFFDDVRITPAKPMYLESELD